jgi:carotenoid cleavage dioxygenase
MWQAEGDKMLQEPCFIPRSAEQGDGWIVQIQAHIEGGNSDLLLFDALKVAEGPVATIHIPFRMRFGLHGNWVDGKELATAIPA